MTALAFLLLLQAPADAASVLRAEAAEELAAGRLESGQVLLSFAHWLAPAEELAALEERAMRELRAARSLPRAALDLSALTDSPYTGLIARCPGPTRALRAENGPFTLTIDGEELVVKGNSVRRRRRQPGEIESNRIVIVSDDETLVIEGRSLSAAERSAPGALAGRLLASEDARQQAAGAMLDSILGVIRALQRLNDHRLMAGVPPVGFSAELSYPCFLHARYLVHESPEKTAGLAMHDEVEGSPWRTEEGAQAARKSCISSYNLDCAVDQWMATLYHRVPLVAPELVRVGLAQAEKDFRYASVIDVLGDRDQTPRRAVKVPGADQTGVPLRLAAGELPDPRPAAAAGVVGYPITLSWYGDAEATAVLHGPRGVEVECWVSTPNAPANAARPDNAASVCLLPKHPLKRKTKYTVTVVAGGETWSWGFTTR